MDDFSEDDMITMRAGASMPLGKDSAGRGILFTSVQHIQAKTYDNQVGTVLTRCLVSTLVLGECCELTVYTSLFVFLSYV